jgi:hypothetical protein
VSSAWRPEPSTELALADIDISMRAGRMIGQATRAGSTQE